MKSTSTAVRGLPVAFLFAATVTVTVRGPEAVASQEEPPAAPAAGQFFQRYCVECHGGSAPEAEISLDGRVERFPTSIRARVTSVLETERMPPEGWDRPSAEERLAFLETWRPFAGSEKPQETAHAGRVPLRRLSREEYWRTIRDLLSFDPRDLVELPQDPIHFGFDHLAGAAELSADLLESYATAAETIARSVITVLPRERAWSFGGESWNSELEPSTRRGFRVLYTRATASLTFLAAWTGRYALRLQVAADRAGDEEALSILTVDGQELGRWSVDRTDAEPGEYEFELELTEGAHEIAVQFPNDFYEPDHPDPALRDRNLLLGNLSIRSLSEPPLSRAQRSWHERDPIDAPLRERARAILGPFADRAFRRPCDDATLDGLIALACQECAGRDSLDAGLRLALQAILTSPRFLLHVEHTLPADATEIPRTGWVERPLDAWSMANRLSYFLWSAPPDEALRHAAAEDRLSVPEALTEQAQRMLDDPRASALAENFAGSWLELKNLDSLQFDPGSFPAFDDSLREDMRRETEMFFETILRERRPLCELLGARFTFVNESLASLYDIEGVRGTHLRRVALDERRSGLLTQASVLALNSHPTRTSPVRRGRWLLDVVLGAPPPPPPATVPPLDETPQAAADASLRERLERHRSDPGCAVCHRSMDAMGLALEHYDPLGRYRDRDGPHVIDARTELPDGSQLENIADLERLLASDPRFLDNLARRLFVYALGRPLDDADGPAVARVVAGLDPRRSTLVDMIDRLVQEDAFRQRRESSEEHGSPTP